MTYESIAVFELALDILGLVICLTVLVYLARHGKSGLVRRSGRRDLAETGVFSAEMRLKTVQQEAEAALAALNDAVAGIEPRPSAVPSSDTADRGPDRPATASTATYETVRQLAGQGMDVDAIYRKLRIPKGEIRLALHLRDSEKGRMRVSA